MLSCVAKSNGMSQYLKATSNAVNAAKSTLAPPKVVAASLPAVFPKPGARLDADTLRLNAPRSGLLKVTTGVNTTASVRCAHTDIRIPDFSDYRRNTTKDPQSRSRETAPARQSFTYLISGVGKLRLQ